MNAQLRYRPQNYNKTSVDSASTFVDYQNLYIKNLDLSLDSEDLFRIFRKFGRIISARVMSYPGTGHSKGYGFVSFSRMDEAAAALQEMDGKTIGSKAICVSYHEPSQPRRVLSAREFPSNSLPNHVSTQKEVQGNVGDKSTTGTDRSMIGKRIFRSLKQTCVGHGPSHESPKSGKTPSIRKNLQNEPFLPKQVRTSCPDLHMKRDANQGLLLGKRVNTEAYP